MRNYGFDDDVKNEILRILNDKRLVQGRKPEVAVAAAVYTVAAYTVGKRKGKWVTQKELAEMLGTTDMTIRLVLRAWGTIPDFRKQYSETYAYP
jgi:transcription initiation factor TFIIIB Brf1 subunit/transcription initiation factor TFIIB